MHAAVGAFSRVSHAQGCLGALAFVVLFKFTDAFSGTMTTPFVIDLGFTRTDYATIVKGVGLAATLIGGFAGGFVARALFADDEPVDRRSVAGGLEFGVRVARSMWRQSMGAGPRHLGGKLHRRDRHRDLRRLSLGPVPDPLHTATQYALLTALAAVGALISRPARASWHEATGWALFFVVWVAVAIPSLFLLAWLQRRGHFEGLMPAKV